MEFEKHQTRCANAALFCVSTFLTPKPPSITGLVTVSQATGVHPLEWLLPVHRKVACVEESLVVYLLDRMVVPTQYYGSAVRTDCKRTPCPANERLVPLSKLILLLVLE